jgi:hypothetical protein
MKPTPMDADDHGMLGIELVSSKSILIAIPIQHLELSAFIGALLSASIGVFKDLRSHDSPPSQ